MLRYSHGHLRVRRSVRIVARRRWEVDALIGRRCRSTCSSSVHFFSQNELALVRYSDASPLMHSSLVFVLLFSTAAAARQLELVSLVSLPLGSCKSGERRTGRCRRFVTAIDLLRIRFQQIRIRKARGHRAINN